MAERAVQDTVVAQSFRLVGAVPGAHQPGPVVTDLPPWRPRLMWARDDAGEYDRLKLYNPRWTAADDARNRLLLRRLRMED